MTGAAAVDFEFALPHMEHAVSTLVSLLIDYLEYITYHLLCMRTFDNMSALAQLSSCKSCKTKNMMRMDFLRLLIITYSKR
jgi:hypothetical protein